MFTVRILRLMKKLVRDEGDWCFMEVPARKRPERLNDPHITTYERSQDVPQSFRKALFLGGKWDLMRRRLDQGLAQVWCYSEDGTNLAAFGWTQNWKPFRRKFGKIARDGVMLGPYWTSPEQRNRGIFKLLNREIIANCPADKRLIFYSMLTNYPSQRGALANGSVLIGFYRVVFWFRLFSRITELPEPELYQVKVTAEKSHAH